MRHWRSTTDWATFWESPKSRNWWIIRSIRRLYSRTGGVSSASVKFSRPRQRNRFSTKKCHRSGVATDHLIRLICPTIRLNPWCHTWLALGKNGNDWPWSCRSLRYRSDNDRWRTLFTFTVSFLLSRSPYAFADWYLVTLRPLFHFKHFPPATWMNS